MAIRVGIALGANLGARVATICEARDRLCRLAKDGTICLQAPLYSSAPVECDAGAPEFLNTVIEIEFCGEPYELLALTQGLEIDLGRDGEHGFNAPREIDVDILYFGDVVLNEERLTIPHPRMFERGFVLQPLSDIRPELVLPTNAATISEIYQKLDSDEPPLVLVQSEW